MSVWLLVDCNNLAHRALHTTGGLSFGGVQTGVSFGLLRDLESLTDLFGADRSILAFDGAGSLRENIYPSYKISRKNRQRTDEERRVLESFYDELARLQSDTLPEAGFKNILSVPGYEGDDIIAQVADTLPAGTEGVIVSSDQDLWQCLSRWVICYNPITKKVVTARSFMAQWGISPLMWASVKALAGCSTDDVEGISGIGEGYASKWFAGTLKPESKAYAKISANLEIFNRNIGLVRLPFPGLRLPETVPDSVTHARLAHVRANLGIRTKRTPDVAGRGFDV